MTDIDTRIQAAENSKVERKPVGLRLDIKLWKLFQASVKSRTKISANEMLEVLMRWYLESSSNKSDGKSS